METEIASGRYKCRREISHAEGLSEECGDAAKILKDPKGTGPERHPSKWRTYLNLPLRDLQLH